MTEKNIYPFTISQIMFHVKFDVNIISTSPQRSKDLWCEMCVGEQKRKEKKSKSKLKLTKIIIIIIKYIIK